MTASATPAPAPKDNLFGVCAALGEDFGFNPLWLRIAFAVALLFSLEGVIATYVALGLIVLVSRLLAPNPKVAALPEPVAAIEEDMPLRKAA